MQAYEITLDNPWVGGAVIGLAVVICVWVQSLTNRLLSIEKYEAIHSVGGIYMSAVGTLYSVVLGMLLVNASEDFSEAKKSVGSEVESLLKIYTGADQLSPAYRSQVKSSIKSYVDGVIDEEWVTLSSGKTLDKTKLLFKNIWFSMRSFEPKTENQKIIFQAMVDAYRTAEESRRERVNFTNYKITHIEWFIMIAGGIVNIAFTFFFSLKSSIIHSIMTGMVTFIVAINLYAVYLLGDPFSSTRDLPLDQLLFLKAYISEGRDL